MCAPDLPCITCRSGRSRVHPQLICAPWRLIVARLPATPRWRCAIAVRHSRQHVRVPGRAATRACQSKEPIVPWVWRPGRRTGRAGTGPDRWPNPGEHGGLWPVAVGDDELTPAGQRDQRVHRAGHVCFLDAGVRLVAALQLRVLDQRHHHRTPALRSVAPRGGLLAGTREFGVVTLNARRPAEALLRLAGRG